VNRSVSESSGLGKNGGDDLSIGGCSIGPSGDYLSHMSQDNSYKDLESSTNMTIRLVNFLSVMYALVIIVIAALICIYDLDTEDSNINHAFMTFITSIGFAWIAFLHWDIHRYKRWAIEYLKPETNAERKRSQYDDNISITTAVIFNTIQQQQPQSSADSVGSAGSKNFETAYRFIHGKHSGNFYLKCGMTGNYD
jgi:hypothetical protein